MQTFLPYADFRRCAEILDDKRLGKQRVETLQIMQVLVRLRWDNALGEIEAFEPRGWRNHPAGGAHVEGLRTGSACLPARDL